MGTDSVFEYGRSVVDERGVGGGGCRGPYWQHLMFRQLSPISCMDNEEVETERDEEEEEEEEERRREGGHSMDPYCVSACMTNDLVEVCHPRRLRRSGSLLTGLLSAAPKNY